MVWDPSLELEAVRNARNEDDGNLTCIREGRRTGCKRA